MSSIAYFDGQFVDRDTPQVLLEDRGYQFADGVYEVCLVVDGKCWDFDGHFARLQRSTKELGIACDWTPERLRIVFRELMLRNRLRTALIYLQMTRGAGRRNHSYTARALSPITSITATRYSLQNNNSLAEKGVAVITHEDIRWGRVDIKTISLLPNCLAKQKAAEAKAAEAWLVRDNFVTEGSSANAWIVDQSGVIISHPTGHDILNGITRMNVLRCAEGEGQMVQERAFTVEEARSAKEAFLTSATNFVMPVVKIDDATIGAGEPGPITRRLRHAYLERAAREAVSLLNPACN